MITEDRVERLFAETNPAPMSLEVEEPNVTAYLATLDERSSEVTETETRERQTTGKAPRPRGWLVAAAVGAVVLAGAVLLNLDSDDVASGPPEVQAVLNAIEAYNEGDIDAWNAAFDPPALSDAGWLNDGELVYFDEILMHANRENTITEPCTVVEPNVVECGLSGYDDFHGPAGILEVGTSRFSLNDQLLITEWDWNSNCCDSHIQFTLAFNVWLSRIHPDVYALIEPDSNDSLPGWRGDPADMAVAIEYVAEFVAQSDFYPLDSAGS